jgi:flagellar motility protein MotE (MotC chaperone)
VALNGRKLGELLLEADILSRRQLQEALAIQASGDKRQLGEILIELGYLTIEDLTEVMLSNGHETTEVSKEAAPLTSESTELSQDTKFNLSIQTMISAAVGIATLVGFWYMMMGEIQEAKELPSLESLYEGEYPSRPEGYNWPRSYEQYKDQVGSLQEDMDEVFETIEEYEEKIEDLEKLVSDLRVQVANKRDK